MLFVVSALIIGIIFGVLATLVVWVAKWELSPAMGIVGGAGFLAGFLISLIQFWYFIPTWGTIVLVGLLLAGIGVIALLRLFTSNFGRLGRSPEKIVVLIIGALLLCGPIYFSLSSMIWRGYDQARC